jgi:hypothetical protein
MAAGKAHIPDKQGINRESVGYKNPPKSTQFKPGQSGNPTGRPKRKYLSEVYAELLEHENEDGEDMATVIARKVLDDALDGDLNAIKEITDRVEGKPRQTNVLSGDPDNPLRIQQAHDLTKLSDEELADLERLVAKSGRDSTGEASQTEPTGEG